MTTLLAFSPRRGGVALPLMLIIRFFGKPTTGLGLFGGQVPLVPPTTLGAWHRLPRHVRARWSSAQCKRLIGLIAFPGTTLVGQRSPHWPNRIGGKPDSHSALAGPFADCGRPFTHVPGGYLQAVNQTHWSANSAMNGFNGRVGWIQLASTRPRAHQKAAA